MAREPGDTQCGRLADGGPLHRRVQDVGQKLHGPIARHHAAVDAQHRFRPGRPVAVHGLQQIARLIAHRLQRRSCELAGPSCTRQAEQRAARLGLPIGRAEPDEGRHEIDVLTGISFGGQRAALRCRGDDAQAVAQPLHRGAGDEDGALQRIGALAVELIGDGGQQPVARGDGSRAGIDEREATGAVGRLDHAGREAGLADGGGLLVAGDAEDGDGCAEDRGFGHSVLSIAVAYLGQDGARHVEEREEIVVEGTLGEVIEQRARGVGGVGGVHFAACEAPDQERVDGAEGQVAGLGERARPFDVIEQPGDLGGREIGIQQQAGLGRHGRLVPRAFQAAAHLRRASVLPHDGAVDGPACTPVPDDAGLALVGDADGGNVARAELGCGKRLPGGLHRRAPDVFRIVLHPPGGWIVLGKLSLGEPQERQVGAEQNRAARGGALIDRQNRPGLGHAVLL